MEALYFLVAILISSPLVLFVVYAAYVHYLHRCYRHLPGPPRSSFFLGHLPDITRNNGTLAYFTENREKYGPIYVLFFGPRPFVVLGNPDFVKQLHITNFKSLAKNSEFGIGYAFGLRFLTNTLLTLPDEESWRPRRQLLDPAFHRKSLKNFLADFNNVCDRFIARLSWLAKEKQDACMASEFSGVTLAIISKVLFNVNIDAIENPDSPFRKVFCSLLRMFEKLSYSSFSFRFFTKFSPIRNELATDARKAMLFLRNYAKQCILQRIEDTNNKKETPDDLLQILVNDKSLPMDDIVSEFISMFAAGHETTANSLSFILYELTQNPEIEKKIVDEIQEVLGDKEYVDYDDLPKLKYLGQVFQEGLRKYPIANGAAKKRITKELVFGGYKIPKNSGILVPKYPMNHNPEYWPNPEVFDPERFSNPQNIRNFNSLYFPFGLGARSCIGQNVSKFESKVLLARMLQKFQFELLPGQTGEITQRFTLTPRDGVMCKITMR